MSRLSFFQDILSSVFDRVSPGVTSADDRTIEELCNALLTERGELSGNQLAQTIIRRFKAADEQAQREMFSLWLTEMDIDATQALASVKAYAADASTEHWRQVVSDTEPRRRELFRRLNRVPGATSELVRIRESLFRHLCEVPDLARVDIDFEHLFSSWFNRGFLVLRQIDWNTPASILEKIIQYEAVHAINDCRICEADWNRKIVVALPFFILQCLMTHSFLLKLL